MLSAALCAWFAIWCPAEPPINPLSLGAVFWGSPRLYNTDRHRRTAVMEFPDGTRMSYRPGEVNLVLCNQAAETEADDDCGEAER